MSTTNRTTRNRLPHGDSSILDLDPSQDLCDIDLSTAFCDSNTLAALLLDDDYDNSIPEPEAEMFADLLTQAEQAWDDVDLDEWLDAYLAR